MKKEVVFWGISFVLITLFGGFVIGYSYKDEIEPLIFPPDRYAEAKSQGQRIFQELNSLCQAYGDDHAAGFITGELDLDKMPKVICYNLKEQKFHYLKIEA